MLISLSAGNNVCDNSVNDIRQGNGTLGYCCNAVANIENTNKQKTNPGRSVLYNCSIKEIAMKLTKYARKKSILLTLKEFYFSSLGKQKPLWWMKLSIT